MCSRDIPILTYLVSFPVPLPLAEEGTRFIRCSINNHGKQNGRLNATSTRWQHINLSCSQNPPDTATYDVQ